jgi:CBS domain-containing protein
MKVSECSVARLHVHDAMNTGILTTDPSTPLTVVAGLMAEQHVHAVAVADPDHARRPWAFVSTLDIAAAAAAGIEETAGDAATTEIVTVSSADRLDDAARIMVEQKLTHLIVIDPASGHPAGVLSTLDIAAAYGSVGD